MLNLEVALFQPVKDETPQDDAQVAALKQAFTQVAGADAEVDAYELQGILNHAFMKGTAYHFLAFFTVHSPRINHFQFIIGCVHL